jgi:NAD(P)-dependent dehydrogenase (short-subunit alcohol dehydrogenase family)
MLRSDGCYMVIGGSGGLGQSIVRWLVERGARHILLLSRRSMDWETLQKLIDAQEIPDLKVMSVSCDVSDRRQVSHLLRSQLSYMPPVCGVIHSAMVLRVSILMSEIRSLADNKTGYNIRENDIRRLQ